MQKILLKATFLILVTSLTACSGHMLSIPGFSTTHQEETIAKKQGLIGKSIDQVGKETNVNITMTGGGEIGLKSMDAGDKSKMSHALDKATGKSTYWKNGATNIGYIVTPIRKILIQGNPFCRSYQVVMMKGDNQKEVNGIACVTSDGNWHTI